MTRLRYILACSSPSYNAIHNNLFVMSLLLTAFILYFVFVLEIPILNARMTFENFSSLDATVGGVSNIKETEQKGNLVQWMRRYLTFPQATE